MADESGALLLPRCCFRFQIRDIFNQSADGDEVRLICGRSVGCYTNPCAKYICTIYAWNSVRRKPCTPWCSVSTVLRDGPIYAQHLQLNRPIELHQRKSVQKSVAVSRGEGTRSQESISRHHFSCRLRLEITMINTPLLSVLLLQRCDTITPICRGMRMYLPL